MAWRYAWNVLKLNYKGNWRGWAGSAAAIPLSLLALWYFLGQEAMANEFYLIISGLIGAAGGALVILMLARISAPSKMYREKEIEAHKYTWADIEIAVFNPPDNSSLGMGLEIINNKLVKVDDFKATVIRFQQGRTNYPYPGVPFSLPFRTGADEDLHWATISLPKEGLRTEFIEIGNWREDENNGMAWLHLNYSEQNGAQPQRVEQGKYHKITIDFQGVVERCNLPKHTRDVELSFDGNKLMAKLIDD